MRGSPWVCVFSKGADNEISTWVINGVDLLICIQEGTGKTVPIQSNPHSLAREEGGAMARAQYLNSNSKARE